MKATEEDYRLARVIERLDSKQLYVKGIRCNRGNKYAPACEVVVMCTKPKHHTGCHLDYIHMNRKPKLLSWQDYIWYD